ncbi:bifunctional inhibitor/lipid-transfer protein/seed storage 2S albumin-like protein [Angomonas deanei]|nr:bifunctional inhibitor/lipid-transfer protein/seed storage 2S albumin-like protein [Angomonas deanei]|eukprot:EPY20169.1 bifunctional inhibitor/lipid-transfer protein/seed storage 2S albumin-like protein [Angomonas deanei]
MPPPPPRDPTKVKRTRKVSRSTVKRPETDYTAKLRTPYDFALHLDAFPARPVEGERPPPMDVGNGGQAATASPERTFMDETPLTVLAPCERRVSPIQTPADISIVNPLPPPEEYPTGYTDYHYTGRVESAPAVFPSTTPPSFQNDPIGYNPPTPPYNVPYFHDGNSLLNGPPQLASTPPPSPQPLSFPIPPPMSLPLPINPSPYTVPTYPNYSDVQGSPPRRSSTPPPYSEVLSSLFPTRHPEYDGYRAQPSNSLFSGRDAPQFNLPSIHRRYSSTRGCPVEHYKSQEMGLEFCAYCGASLLPPGVPPRVTPQTCANAHYRRGGDMQAFLYCVTCGSPLVERETASPWAGVHLPQFETRNASTTGADVMKLKELLGKQEAEYHLHTTSPPTYADISGEDTKMVDLVLDKLLRAFSVGGCHGNCGLPGCLVCRKDPGTPQEPHESAPQSPFEKKELVADSVGCGEMGKRQLVFSGPAVSISHYHYYK